MRKPFGQRFREFFQFVPALPVVTEESALYDIADQHPHLFDFLSKRYGVTLTSLEHRITLKELCRTHALAPPQIVFMEVQMASRTAGVRHLSAREAKQLLDEFPKVQVVDAREEWERKICKLENSEFFTDELLTRLDPTIPVLLYCHFGVRSFNAAALLKDSGFEEVYVLQGGIEAWSIDVDPAMPRYEAAYC